MAPLYKQLLINRRSNFTENKTRSLWTTITRRPSGTVFWTDPWELGVRPLRLHRNGKRNSDESKQSLMLKWMKETRKCHCRHAISILVIWRVWCIRVEFGSHRTSFASHARIWRGENLPTWLRSFVDATVACSSGSERLTLSHIHIHLLPLCSLLAPDDSSSHFFQSPLLLSEYIFNHKTTGQWVI